MVPSVSPFGSNASNVTVASGPPSTHTRPAFVGRPPSTAALNTKRSRPQNEEQLAHALLPSTPSSQSTASMIMPLKRVEVTKPYGALTPGVLSKWSSKSSSANEPELSGNGLSAGLRYGVGP